MAGSFVVLLGFIVISVILAVSPTRLLLKNIAGISIASSIIGTNISPSFAEEQESLGKYLDAVKVEVVKKPSVQRLRTDIDSNNWEDLKLFTREFEAGFRGGVLKKAWKQLEGEDRKRGIDLSNSFTYDLIGINKAGRQQDPDAARKYLGQVETDLQDFLTLLEKQPITASE